MAKASAKYGRHMMMPEMIINAIVTTVIQNTHFCPMLYLSMAGRSCSRFSMKSRSRLLHSRSYGWILLSVQ